MTYSSLEETDVGVNRQSIWEDESNEGGFLDKLDFEKEENVFKWKERWEDGKTERWKDGKMEKWKNGKRSEGIFLPYYEIQSSVPDWSLAHCSSNFSLE